MAGTYLFEGVGAALVTLFGEDGSLDAAATAEHAGRIVEAGVSAVVVAGTTGEAAALTAEERTELLVAVRKVVHPRSGVPLIAGTGATSIDGAVSFTRDAREAGADAVLALSLPGATDQRPYYAAVAQAAGELPVLAYHFPKVSSPGIDLDELAGLPVAGLKDSSGDAAHLLWALESWGRPVYAGAAALITMAGAVGCAGVIVGLANAEPEKCIAAFKGDGSAQLRLGQAIRVSQSRFPGRLKELVSERFGTSTVTRLG
jgi:4-hydroxy-tetrahydrodipicolinate synthase